MGPVSKGLFDYDWRDDRTGYKTAKNPLILVIHKSIAVQHVPDRHRILKTLRKILHASHHHTT